MSPDDDEELNALLAELCELQELTRADEAAERAASIPQPDRERARLALGILLEARPWTIEERCALGLPRSGWASSHPSGSATWMAPSP